MTKKYIASLFAGMGGIDLGFKQAGFETKWANEFDKKACETYAANFKSKLICGDIKKLKPAELSRVHVLTAGFPCQPYTKAGKQKGLADSRGGAIFSQLMRVIKGVSPRIVFLENIKNIKSFDEGKVLKHIIKKINDAGYSVKFSVLNTCEYSDLPQNRERIFFVCFKYKKDFNSFSFPKKAKKRRTIKELLDTGVPAKYYLTADNCVMYRVLKKGITDKKSCYTLWWNQLIKKGGNVCPTLLASVGPTLPLILVRNKIRRLTPRECARFQGFPETFIFPEDHSDCHRYKQVGNSVSVPVVKRIAQNIMKTLKS